jgi:hypothetical protein
MNAAEALNRAFEADPDAIRALMTNRVPCNMRLADDPFVQVGEGTGLHGQYFIVGALGLVNAVLAAHGLPLVAGKWEMNEPGNDEFVGFCEYVREEDVWGLA